MREYKTYIETHLTNEPILPKKTIFEMGKDLFAIENKEDFQKSEKGIADKKDTNSKLLTTKELSELTGKSSRKINNWLSDNRLMYKKDSDWITTKKGKDIGGVEKDGQWGKYHSPLTKPSVTTEGF